MKSDATDATDGTIRRRRSRCWRARRTRAAAADDARADARTVDARAATRARGTRDGDRGRRRGGDDDATTTATNDDDGGASDARATSEDIGAAIRAAKEAKADEGTNVFAGAAEEVGLIEWPTAGGALSTTALVMAGIFGSAGVLLGVNAALSELSQKLFP